MVLPGSAPVGFAVVGSSRMHVLAIARRPVVIRNASVNGIRRQCAQWNRKNQAYFRSIYLQKKVEGVEKTDSASSGSDSGETAEKSRTHYGKPPLPLSGFQEVISVQQFVIIDYLIRLSLRRFQEVIKSQAIERPG